MKVLYVTTIGPTMSFFYDLFKDFKNNGVEIELACSLSRPVANNILELGITVHEISFSRSPLSKSNLKAYKQLKKLIENEKYDIVHCHTPNASVITRLVCKKLRKKNGLKVFYTAHGFHFYKGAPLKNWFIYYPIEKYCSRYTDKLITINQEDYKLAKSKFHAKEICYVPGVGVDLKKFENVQVDKNAKRREIGVPEDSFLIISVGELSKRKNHRVIIQAMAKINDGNIHYIIVGQGAKLLELKKDAEHKGLENNVHFLGYRNDIAELYKASDICCLPSIHEGLSVALMEAMACKVPVICSKIRGNIDLINAETGFLVDTHDVDGYASALYRCFKDYAITEDFVRKNSFKIKMFGSQEIIAHMERIYQDE